MPASVAHDCAPQVVVVVSATSEWRALDRLVADAPRRRSPFGDWFALPEPVAGLVIAVVHGGWERSPPPPRRST